MTRLQKHADWQQHLQAWETSGLTQSAYCEQHRLKLATFTYWRARLPRTDQTSPSSRPALTLVPVKRTLAARHDITTARSVVLHSPGGWRLEIPADPPLLAELLRALP
jgi:hypothetical protein